MKRIILTGLAILATITAQAQIATNSPAPQLSAITAEHQAELALRADEDWKQLPPDAKIRLLNLHKALTGMQPEERRFVHERIERFLNLSPADRERIKKNSERWHTMSPEERERAREQFHQWRKDHPGELPPPLTNSTNSQQSASKPPTPEIK